MPPLHSTETFGTNCHFTCPLLFCCVFVKTKVSNRSDSRLEERNRDLFFFPDQMIVTAGSLEKYRNRRLRINAAVTHRSTSNKVWDLCDGN